MNKAVIISATQPVDPKYGKDITEFLAYVARVSNPENQHNHLTAKQLLTYLRKHKHWSPFEMADVTFEIETSRDIARQILRHRSFSFQEFSQRYAISSFLKPKEARLQDVKNRQNSLETDDEELARWWEESQSTLIDWVEKIYKKALSKGLAKEVARVILPEGLTKSTLYMKGSIRSWLHYIEVRTDETTQKEHRELASMIEKKLQEFIGEFLICKQSA